MHEPSAEPLELRGCRVDLATGAVEAPHGERRTLRGLERAVLAYLVRHTGRHVPQDELLQEVWAYGERVVSRTVYSTIRRLREQIEVDPTCPDHVGSQRGAGYRFVPLEREHLPPPPLGRDDDLARLQRRLREGDALITVLGPAGIGKSTLAHYLAATSDRAATVVELATATSVASVAAAILQALDLDATGANVDRLGELIGARGPRLVVLDHFEHLVPVAAAAVAAWQRQAPDVRFVVTSQVALKVANEAIVELAGLAPEAARQLLVQRAERTGHRSRPEEIGVLDEIAAHLQGIPLALLLAGARLRLLGPLELLRRLQDDGLDVLDGGPRDEPTRHRSMASALRASWDLLPERTRHAAAQCTVFAGSFDAAAFEAVVEVEGAEELTVLEELTDHSWLSAVRGRFGMLRALRRFAARQLVEPIDVQRRHAAWALVHASDRDRAADLRLVVDRFVAGDPPLAATAALAASEGLVHDGHVLLDAELLDRVAPVLPHLAPVEAMTLGLQRVRALRRAYRLTEAKQQLADLRGLGPSCGPRSRGAWWSESGAVAIAAGELAPAEADLQQAVEILQQDGPSSIHASLLSTLGVLRWRLGQPEEARRLLRASVAMHEACGGGRHLVVALSNLAMVLQGRWSEMEAAARRTVEMAEQLGTRRVGAIALSNRGLALHELGHPEEAAVVLEHCLESMERLGHARERAHVLVHHAVACFAGGAHEQALSELEEALAEHRRLDNPIGHRLGLGNRGILRAVAGQLDDADADLRAALATFDVHPRPESHRCVLACVHAVVSVRRGLLHDAGEALALARRALPADHGAAEAMVQVAAAAVALAGELPGAREQADEALARAPASWDHGVLQDMLATLVR